MRRRYPEGWGEDYQMQAEYEMGVIIRMGFPGYFLVVADFIM
jgi:DNA polymerase-3 subunit alpha